jgi:primosomal protein N' (replication factor Y)
MAWGGGWLYYCRQLFPSTALTHPPLASHPPPLYLQVAIPSPLHRSFDYLPLPGVVTPKPGSRVRVPFGSKSVVGIVVGLSTHSEVPADKLRAAEQVLDSDPLLGESLLALYRWASQHYLFPLGLALQTSLPKPLREGELPTLATALVWERTEAQASGRPPGASAQHLLDCLQRYQRLSSGECSALLGKPARPLLTTLQKRGLVREIAAESAPREARQREAALTLNPEQAAALAALRLGPSGFRCSLLEGVTGSGKTEIYLQLIADVLSTGRQVLVLVPEITLTPQTIARFARRFEARIIAFHSGLTDKQRLQGWLEAANGSAHLVIGTRSAVFTPLARPGLIVVDEEHDDSYKQQDGFRYSGRDVAVYRARQLDIPILLGSATPSLESLHNALQARYQLLTLHRRAGPASLPDIGVLDMKLQPAEAGISAGLRQRIAATLAGNAQVLVFLNRRGFAPLLRCGHCGWIAECQRCERSFTLHQQPAQLRCHHCDGQRALPRSCPQCRSHDLEAVGLGTERSADYLQACFPDYPVLRIDRDSTRSARKFSEAMDIVQSGVPCILVGTQMLAKGHHFPRVTLVAVLDADGGLFSADFRAQENFGQLLMQVAGRAGRAECPGSVVVQSFHPEHPALRYLVTEGYGPFARQLLSERRSGGLPPFSHFLLLRAEAARRDLPLQFLLQAAELLQREAPRGVSCHGPLPSPFGKKAGVFRAQLLLQATRRAPLQQVGARLLAALEQDSAARRVRWFIDVDPLDFS